MRPSPLSTPGAGPDGAVNVVPAAERIAASALRLLGARRARLAWRLDPEPAPMTCVTVPAEDNLPSALGDAVAAEIAFGERAVREGRALCAPDLLAERYLKLDVPAREVANQLAIAIVQARLLEQVKRQAVELEARVEERTRELEGANRELEASRTPGRTISSRCAPIAREITSWSRSPIKGSASTGSTTTDLRHLRAPAPPGRLPGHQRRPRHRATSRGAPPRPGLGRVRARQGQHLLSRAARPAVAPSGCRAPGGLLSCRCSFQR